MTLALLMAGVCYNACGADADSKTQGPNNSNLNSELMYQILVGEFSAQAGDLESAYAVALSAARKSREPKLYERSVDLGLRLRKGDLALEAAKAWVQAWPASQPGNRYLFQILVLLNRVAEAQEPLKRDLTAMTPAERIVAISMLPRQFSRVTDKKLAVTVVEKALASELTNPTTGTMAWSALGSLRIQADDPQGALESVRKGAALDPRAKEPVLLAIALMAYKAPQAEAIALKYFNSDSGHPLPELRMAYIRQLVALNRSPDAYAQALQLTGEKPDYAPGWLIRAGLELQERKLAQAKASVEAYLTLHPKPSENEPATQMDAGLVQAYLMLAQIAEQNNQLDEAIGHLDKIDSPHDALRVQKQRAAILVRQGKHDAALAAIRSVPEMQATDAQAKISAEVHVLRESRDYATAYRLLQDAITRYPQEPDLVYDLAMVAERMGNLDEMEQLLRQIIASHPEYYNAYNALGYTLANQNVRLSEARDLITKALEFSPNDPYVTDSLGWLEFRLGNTAEALRLLQSAYKTRPDAEIAAHLGEVLWNLDQKEEARAIWKEAIRLYPENETLVETLKRLQINP